MSDRSFSPASGISIGRFAVPNDPVVIGLVNNMPDGALVATERRFAALLIPEIAQAPVSAAQARAVTLRIFAIPQLPRGDYGRRVVEERYEPIDALWEAKLDGLIVTGMEPRAPDFEDELYWPIFENLVDWADEHTHSTIWSCLAAHAAAYHLDGIRRQAVGGKLSGVFECAVRERHEVLAHCPSRWLVPHSRHYGLPEEVLLARGYRVLTASPVVGPDIFVKKTKALHVFQQGHLEYDGVALALEYRRDVKRYLRGERDSYPEIPCGTFDRETDAALCAFRERATRERSMELIADVPASGLAHAHETPWQRIAQQVYRDWIAYLAERKSATHSDAEFAADTDSRPQLASA
jgi:homoserine O-succinyltransferase/O-acetyltransferase